MKAKEIRDLIDFISETGLEEVNIETQEFKISVKRSPDMPVTAAPAPMAVPAPAPVPVASTPAPAEAAPAKQEAPAADEKLVAIKSPMIGTFYRSSSPEADAFVSVGSEVSKGATVCIIEAMKLFNEIESDVSGKIVKVLVDNASPVEYDQPLFLVDPS